MQAVTGLGAVVVGLVSGADGPADEGSVLFLAHFDQPKVMADFAAGGVVAPVVASGVQGGRPGRLGGAPSCGGSM